MGWWADKQGDVELIVGDDPYDALSEALDRIVQAYEEEWERKPTLEELIHSFEVVLGADMERYVKEGDTLELVALKAKTKKRRKSQPYKVGDFFAIPLEDGRYAFGRILSDILEEEMGMLVGIYNIVSRRILSPEELRNLPWMFTPFYCSDQGWTSWRWRIIGHLPIAEDEFEYPLFKQGTDFSGWKILDRDQLRPATEEEVKDLGYPTLRPMKAVERRIKEFLAQQG